jgi:predicted secreted protein
MTAVKGKGAKLWLWDSTIVTPALVKIADLLAVTPPQPRRDTIDATHHESSGDYREFISSLIDAGEATATIHFDPNSATDVLLADAFADGDIRAFAIDINKSGGTQRRYAGSAILVQYAPQELTIDGKQTAQITLKASGPVVQGAIPA